MGYKIKLHTFKKLTYSTENFLHLELCTLAGYRKGHKKILKVMVNCCPEGYVCTSFYLTQNFL